MGFTDLQLASDLPQETSLDEARDRGCGPQRRQQAVVLPFAQQLLELRHVGLDAWAAKRQQLANLQALLQRQGGLLFATRPEQQEAEAVTVVLCRMLLAVAATAPLESGDEAAPGSPADGRRSAIACGVRGFHAALAAGDNNGARQTGQALAAHLEQDKGRALPSLDEPLRRHLIAALDAVARGCSRDAGGMEEEGEGEGSSLAWYGLAWAHLGLAAMRLALPQNSIDGASAVSFELGEAAGQCRALRLAVRCREAVRDVNVGYGNRGRIAALLAERAGALERARVLVDDVVFREDHAQYPELYNGLHTCVCL